MLDVDRYDPQLSACCCQIIRVLDIYIVLVLLISFPMLYVTVCAPRRCCVQVIVPTGVPVKKRGPEIVLKQISRTCPDPRYTTATRAIGEVWCSILTYLLAARSSWRFRVAGPWNSARCTVPPVSGLGGTKVLTPRIVPEARVRLKPSSLPTSSRGAEDVTMEIVICSFRSRHSVTLGSRYFPP